MGSIPMTYRHFSGLSVPPMFIAVSERLCDHLGMRLILLMTALTLTTPARAEATTAEFLGEYQSASEDGKRYLEGFLGGLVAAYSWANITLKAEGKQPLYCLNEFGGKEIEHPVRLLRNAAANHPGIKTSPVGMAMLANLKRRWPCRPTKLKKKDNSGMIEPDSAPAD